MAQKATTAPPGELKEPQDGATKDESSMNEDSGTTDQNDQGACVLNPSRW